jgi:hypothetical protein
MHGCILLYSHFVNQILLILSKYCMKHGNSHSNNVQCLCTNNSGDRIARWAQREQHVGNRRYSDSHAERMIINQLKHTTVVCWHANTPTNTVSRAEETAIVGTIQHSKQHLQQTSNTVTTLNTQPMHRQTQKGRYDCSYAPE